MSRAVSPDVWSAGPSPVGNQSAYPPPPQPRMRVGEATRPCGRVHSAVPRSVLGAGAGTASPPRAMEQLGLSLGREWPGPLPEAHPPGLLSLHRVLTLK